MVVVIRGEMTEAGGSPRSTLQEGGHRGIDRVGVYSERCWGSLDEWNWSGRTNLRMALHLEDLDTLYDRSAGVVDAVKHRL